MIYFYYGLRWKDYKTLQTLEKEKRSEFEMKYENSCIRQLNQDFYIEYVKKEDYLLMVTDVSDSEIEIYAAVDIKYLEQGEYEKTILHTFSDCDLIGKREVTITEYKREMGREQFYTMSTSTIFGRLGIDYRESFFDRFPFDYEEEVIESLRTDKKCCLQRAKSILGSKSLLEEIDRIYSKENQKIYLGHPVHYMISAGDWGAAEDIYRLLLRALIYNKRLLSNRVTIIRNMQKGMYRDNRIKEIIRAANGGVIIIELKSEDGMGRFATDFHETTRMLGDMVEENKKDTLFLFVEITGKSLKDNDAINNILNKADVIQIREGTGTYAQAKRYLTELIDKVDFPCDDKDDAYQFLPEKESYTVTDIYNAYNAWYGSGLKNHVYKAYKEKKSFKVEVTKVENKPYEELQDMIGLTEVKSVIDRIVAASRVLRVRERMGLKTEDTSLHMMFAGNPGTAKTTVARLLTKILKDEDAIQSGKFVECGRQDLVGRYVGWTAHIVEEKFKEAMGGVLFIDEAYALVDDSNTFGAEAINTITQMMENYRDDVIVIFAGYPDKMKDFLDQNEGLKSRIAYYLDFTDYRPDELIKILELMAKKKEYTIGTDALETCREIFGEAVREENYGNGRFVRNVLEQAILRQSDRLIHCDAGKELSREEVCYLKKEDFAFPEKCPGRDRKIIGFCGR